MAASALFYASASFISKLQPTEQVQLNLRSYAWLADLRLRLDRPEVQEAQAPLTTEAAPVAVAKASVVASLPAALPEIKPQSKPRLKSKPASSKAKRSVQNARPLKQQDQVLLTAAAPEAPAPKALTEGERMQQLHLFLRAQLIATVRPELGVNPERVAGLTTHKPAPTLVSIQKRSSPRKAMLAKRVIKPDVSPETHEGPGRLAEIKTSPVEEAQKSKGNPETSLISSLSASKAFKAKLGSNLRRIERKEDLTLSPAKGLSLAQGSVTRKHAENIQAPTNSADADIEAIQARLRGILAASGGSPEGHEAGVNSQGRLTTQGSDLLATSQSHSKGNQGDGYSTPGGYSCKESLVKLESAPSQAVQVASYNEAFEWEMPLHGVTSEMLTHETLPTRGPVKGWELSRAPGHWPTLARRPVVRGGDESSAKAIPLISVNNATMLAMTTGARLEDEAGILFGKLPQGWSVSFSGRSERLVLLNDRNEALPAGTSEGVRYFAFMNAEPGAHLLQLTSKCSGEAGAFDILVLSGTSTYVDFTELRHTQLTGRVLDASEATARPIPKAGVRLRGNLAGAQTLTDSQGYFTIPSVLVLPDHPVLIETNVLVKEGEGGYVHRYERDPSQLKDVFLFRFGEKQIDEWIGQLQGGISPDSGLVLAMAPAEVMAAHGMTAIFPELEHLGANATLQPETYTLSPEGQVLAGMPLDLEQPRIMGVQLPKGPAVLRLQSADQRTVWSKLSVTESGVVSVIGPN